MNKKIFAPHALAALILLSAGSSWADEATSPATTSFDIPPQNLEAALIRFSEQSDIQLVMASADVDGKEVEGVVGDLTHQEALVELLDNTGLEYRFVNDETVAIGVSDKGGDSDSKNSMPQLVLMAQNQTIRTPTTSSGGSDDGDTGVITGRVTDVRTGANLKGAKVIIDETGQWTRTDNLGEFRFASVPAGSATLTVSFLGYAGQSAIVDVRAPEVAQDFALRGGSEIEEIVVFGQRSARAQALNLERTADNFTTVITSDLLGNFIGTTISEALRRAPGVAFEQDFDTGDGTNIIVRGIEPDLNQVTLNGLRLPEGDGVGRSPDLSGILTESIESVTINKTLLPSHDSNGVGGLVEIETKAPLDRPDRFAGLGVEYGEHGNDQGEDLLLSGTLSGVLGNAERLGASLSVQYRDRSVTNINYDTTLFFRGGSTGNYLPLDENGDPIESLSLIDPRTAFPFDSDQTPLVYPTGTNTAQTTADDENLSLTGSLQQKFGSHTDLRLDVTYTDIKRITTSLGTSAFVDSSRFLAPIPELGGELRSLPTVDSPSPFLPDGINFGVERSFARAELETETMAISLRGDTIVDWWTFDYSGGFVSGKSDSPYDASVRTGEDPDDRVLPRNFLLDEVVANQFDGRVVSVFNPLQPDDSRFILPGLNAAGIDFFNDPNSVVFTQAVFQPGDTSRTGSNDRITLKGSARRDLVMPYLRYVEGGLFYETAEFESRRALNAPTYRAASGVTVGDLGLSFAPGLLTQVGADFDFDSLDADSALALLDSLDTFEEQGLLSSGFREFDPRIFDLGSTEEDFALYVQGRIDVGDIEVIGGVRYSRVEIESDIFTGPNFIDAAGVRDLTYADRFGQIVTGSATQTDLLPRVQTNYRFSDRMTFRLGYFTTVSRPRIENISDRRTITLDLRPRYGDGSQPRLFVSQGNPGLEPATTHNLDLSWEWFTDDVGVIKLSAFYKATENLPESAETEGGLEIAPADLALPDTPEFNSLPENLFVQVSQPVNSEDTAEIWGAEFAFERQLTFLPGAWSGLGVYGNYTYTDSARDTEFFFSGSAASASGFITIPDVPYTGSPEYSYTAALTYAGYSIDASLHFTRQDRRLLQYEEYALHSYAEAAETLDARVEYLWKTGRSDIRVFLRADDLLRDSDDAYLETSIGGDDGIPIYTTGGRYFGGRSFFVGLSTAF